MPQRRQAKCEISSKTHIFWKPTVRRVQFSLPVRIGRRTRYLIGSLCRCLIGFLCQLFID
ncbi:hypothetical protein T03_8259 [Trichinella britovi]|uniref:Uncharacterized protein n=1 Tax=Trichinella britovi TaxID=45882 RepID=A0A0V1D0R2_TRIBR|nr:hypothetical protein T03_8259 [Trichinella britovi]